MEPSYCFKYESSSPKTSIENFMTTIHSCCLHITEFLLVLNEQTTPLNEIATDILCDLIAPPGYDIATSEYSISVAHASGWRPVRNWPTSQIPWCIWEISYNAPFCNRSGHFCYKIMHCGLGLGASWDLCNKYIGVRRGLMARNPGMVTKLLG